MCHIGSDPVLTSVADLVDLRGQKVAKNVTFDMASPTFPKISNFTFEKNVVQFTMPVGEAIGINLKKISIHPFHIHVNPFQLTQNPLETYENNWFRSGDWHDTLFYPTKEASNQRVLTQTDYFTGPSVIHCHILDHEDIGMMITFNLTGEEGTRYQPAYGYKHTPTYGSSPSFTARIDPSCYDGMVVNYPKIITEGKKCAIASKKVIATTAFQLSTATAEAHTWKVIAIVLGSVLAVVLLLVAAVWCATSHGGSPAGAAPASGAELM